MLRIKVHTKSSFADFVAVPGKSLRFILPSRHIFAVSLIFIISAMFMLPKTQFTSSGSEEIELSAESRAYLMAEQDEHKIELPTTGDLENYEDYDIPQSLFKQPAAPAAKNHIAKTELSRSAAVAAAAQERAEVKETAKALEQAVLAQNAPSAALSKSPESAKADPKSTELPAALPSEGTVTASLSVGSTAPASNAATAASELAKAEPAPEPRPESVWYQQTVKRGDSLSHIFNYLNLPTATLNKIVAAAKKSDLFLQPGQKIQFLIDENNVVKEMVKPAMDADSQVRFTRMQADDNFRVVYEPANAHVDNPKLIARFESASMMPLAKKAAEERQKREEARALQKEEEAKALAASNANPLRPRLVYGTLEKGESFKTFAKRIGLTPTEVTSIERIISGKGKTSALKQGDNVRVLFDGIGTRALINAVAIDSKSLGSLSFYRNLEDKNFYEEGGYVPTAGIFRRFPLASNIKVNSKFNMHRRHPVTGKIAPHKGVDFKAAVGTPVYAPADGVVTFAGYQRAAGYYIILRHANGYSTVYMHLSKIDVKKDQKVYVGQIIAKTGNTGRTTGPHLHYEIRINDRPVDPLKIDLPSSSHPNLAHEQREAFKSTVQVFKQELYNDALAKND